MCADGWKSNRIDVFVAGKLTALIESELIINRLTAIYNMDHARTGRINYTFPKLL